MNEIFLNFLYKLLLDFLTAVLIPAIVGVVFMLIKNELAKHKIFQNQLVRDAAVQAVRHVEQLYRTGKLKGIEMSSQRKFDEALDIAENLLATQGIKVELHVLGSFIESSVFSEINNQLTPFLNEILSVPETPAPSKESDNDR